MSNLLFYRALQISFLVVSVIFLSSISVLPFPVFVLLKITPALLAASIAYLYSERKGKHLLTITFLFLAIGDLLLGLNRTKYFIFALIVFLIGNVLLLIYMIPFAGRKSTGIIRGSTILLYSLVAAFYILPNSGKFLLPVMVYLIVISSMSLISALNISRRQWLIFIGAAAFILSDSIIAFDKFVHPVSGSLPVILVLYYTAVYCLCFGIVPPPVSDRTA